MNGGWTGPIELDDLNNVTVLDPSVYQLTLLDEADLELSTLSEEMAELRLEVQSLDDQVNLTEKLEVRLVDAAALRYSPSPDLGLRGGARALYR